MDLIKKTNRKIGRLDHYDGICGGCGTPLTYDGELIVVTILDNDEKLLLVPIDTIACPCCSRDILVITLWKNLDVSKELAHLETGVE